MRVLALIGAFLLGWFAQDAWEAMHAAFTRWRAHRPRRFPDPFEHEYRLGWLWGVACGTCLGGLVGALVVLAWEGHLL